MSSRLIEKAWRTSGVWIAYRFACSNYQIPSLYIVRRADMDRFTPMKTFSISNCLIIRQLRNRAMSGHSSPDDDKRLMSQQFSCSVALLKYTFCIARYAHRPGWDRNSLTDRGRRIRMFHSIEWYQVLTLARKPSSWSNMALRNCIAREDEYERDLWCWNSLRRSFC